MSSAHPGIHQRVYHRDASGRGILARRKRRQFLQLIAEEVDNLQAMIGKSSDTTRMEAGCCYRAAAIALTTPGARSNGRDAAA